MLDGNSFLRGGWIQSLKLHLGPFEVFGHGRCTCQIEASFVCSRILCIFGK